MRTAAEGYEDRLSVFDHAVLVLAGNTATNSMGPLWNAHDVERWPGVVAAIWQSYLDGRTDGGPLTPDDARAMLKLLMPAATMLHEAQPRNGPQGNAERR